MATSLGNGKKLPGPLWPGVVVPVRVICMDQIDSFEND